MKAVVFDVDGTLIESMAIDSGLYFSAVKSVLGDVEIRADLDNYDNVTDSGILAQLIDDNRIFASSAVVKSVQTRFVESLQEYIRSVGPFAAIHGAKEFVDRLRNSPEYDVAIATGGWRNSALVKLESAGFDVDGMPLATCDDSPSRTHIMRIALSRLGDRFESVTYFGDARWDKRACRNLGWRFVAVGPELGGIISYNGVRL